MSATEITPRARLTAIFLSVDPRDAESISKFPAEEVLSLLRENSPLVVQNFLFNQLPISFFLQCHSNLDQIREISSLMIQNATPEKQWWKDRLTICDFCGIWDVCQYGAEDGVFEFLTQEMIPALDPNLFQFASGMFPPFCQKMEEFLAEDNQLQERTQEEKIDILKRIIKACPLTLFGSGGKHLLDGYYQATLVLALRGNLGQQLMHFIFQECGKFIQKNYPEGVQCSSIFAQTRIGLPQARALSMLLPGLSALHLKECTWRTWTSAEALVFFLNELGMNTTIRELLLVAESSTTATSLFEDNEVNKALQKALAKNRGISCLRFLGCPGPLHLGKTLQAIASGLASNSTVDTLFVQWCWLSDANALACFLSKFRLKRFVFVNASVEGPWTHYSFEPDCHLESLEINLCDLGTIVALSGLIAQVHNIPKLQELILYHIDDDRAIDLPKDLTLPLRESLGLHKCSLKKLDLTNIIIDVDVLKDILLNNNKLETLRLRNVNHYTYKATVACAVNHLEYHSAIMTSCELIDDTGGTFDRAIFEDLMKSKYYVALNQDGKRAQARNQQQITLEGFVGLLTDVITTPPANPLIRDVLECRGGDYEHNLQYGLLQANPHLWSRP